MTIAEIRIFETNHSDELTTIMSATDVEKATGLKRRWIAVLESRGEFPRRCQLGGRRVGWYADEILAWQNARRSRRV